MKKGILLILALVAGWQLAVAAEALHIVPRPQSCVMQNGTFALKNGVKFYTNMKGADKTDFTPLLSDAPLKLSEAKTAKKAQIVFEITPAIGTGTGNEGYELTVTSQKAVVKAKTPAGLFYGLQTLIQAVSDDGSTIPCMEIKDNPRFAYRGLHLDVSRHFQTVDYIKKQLRAMARYKLNRFHWHLTDGAGWRLEIKKYPRLTEKAAYRPYATWKEWWKADRRYCEKNDSNAYGGYYTQQDARDVVDYARKLHITVIPEIEMPGHSEEVMAVFPEMSCSGKPYVNSEFCIGKEVTFTFLQDVLDEVMDIFPSKFIHIGGDEANKEGWKKCPDCQARMKDENLKTVDELQSYLVHRIEKYLNSKGRDMMGWDEILEGGLSPNATVMSWRGESGGITAAKAHHDVVMTPGEYCYIDAYQDAPVSEPEAIGGYLTLEKVYSYDPVPHQLSPEEQKYILGVQANVWTEYMTTPEHVEHMIYPRLLAIAEDAWTDPSQKNWLSFRANALREVKWLQGEGYHPFDLSKEVGNRPGAGEVRKHLAVGKKITYNKPYSKQYAAGGDNSLIDGKCGGWSYNDHMWQGFIGENNLDVTIDLGEVQPLTSILATFMQLTGPWVWMPRQVVIEASSDGEEFTTLATIDNDVPTDYDLLKFKDFGWTGNAKARYIRYQAFINPDIVGGWIFTDEIIVK